MSQNVRTKRDRRLIAYAMGGLAMTTAEASGEIVYRQLGPQVIHPNESFTLDLDQNGFDDLTLSLPTYHWSHCTSTSTSTSCWLWGTCWSTSTSWLRGGGRGGGGWWSCTSSSGVSAWAQGLGSGRAAARLIGNGKGGARLFQADELINPGLADQASARLAYFTHESRAWTYHGGDFHGVRGYLGFGISGGMRAGWAQIEVALSEVIPNEIASIRIFDYAYQTEYGTPLAAGDTGADTGIPGDTNGDGKVDLADLNNVRNNFGASGDGILGDTNGDDLVDLEDLNAVRNNFGAGSAVPEPPSLVLLAAGAAGLAVLRRKRNPHAHL